MIAEYKERYPALHATPELVGRESVLSQCRDILIKEDTAPKLVFIYGQGGIGKTRLLKKVLEMANDANCFTAKEVLDFYDVLFHTPVEMCNGVLERLQPSSDDFKAYYTAAWDLTRARFGGDGVAIKKLRETILIEFEKGLIELAKKQRVVIAFDTLERVVYGIPGLTEIVPFAEAWAWVMERIAHWQNVIIFAAGRKESLAAIEDASNDKAALISKIEIPPFTLEESMKYFAQVSETLGTDQPTLSQRLGNMPETFKQAVHFYAEGRPILLSLFVDYLSVGGEGDLIEMLREPLPEKITEEHAYRYETFIFERIRNTNEIGDTLIALGRAPQGVDENLLSKLLEISVPEAQKRLEQIQNLSIIKIRQRAGQMRFFLHDEMYDLLHRHVYNGVFDANRQEHAFAVTKKYYQRQRDASIQRLNALYAPIEERGQQVLDMIEVEKAHAVHQSILTDMLYYYIRKDLGRGFRTYIRFSQESVLSRDALTELQLQSEMLAYLSVLTTSSADKTDQDISIDMLLASLKIRPVARAWASTQYDEGLKIAHKLISTVESEWQVRYPELFATLHVWTASLHTLRGQKEDLNEADEHLKVAYSLLPANVDSATFSNTLDQNLLWYKKFVFAFAHRVHGYLKRVRGLYKEAISEYKSAAVVLRGIDLRAEMATTKNDMGYAQSQIGQYADARANILHSLQLRRDLGRRVPVALSLNTLAEVDLGEGHYEEARQNSERALAIFRAFSLLRGMGLSLITLSEVTWRYAGKSPLLSTQERISMLKQARSYAKEAEMVFRGTPETSRLIEAQIEIASACRDLVKWTKKTTWTEDNIEDNYHTSLNAIKSAQKVAQQNNLIHKYLEARINQAWLEYYYRLDYEKVFDLSQVNFLIDEIEGEFPVDTDGENHPQFWIQKGRLYMLKGHLSKHLFDFQRKEKPKGLSLEIESILQGMADNYARALEFSAKFSEDYQGIRRAKDSIFQRLKDLNLEEIKIVCNQIKLKYPAGSIIQAVLTNRALWVTE